MNNNIQFFPPLDDIFPKPPFHYKNDNLMPPNLDLIHQYINPEYVSFGKTMKVYNLTKKNQIFYKKTRFLMINLKPNVL